MERAKFRHPQIIGNDEPFLPSRIFKRLTETIPFALISRDNALKIFEIHLKKELLDLAKNLNIDLIISQEAKEYLSKEGYDIKYGARPFERELFVED